MRKRIRLIGSGRSSDLLDTTKKSLSIPALLLHRLMLNEYLFSKKKIKSFDLLSFLLLDFKSYVVHGFTLYVDTPGVLLSFATQFEIEH